LGGWWWWGLLLLLLLLLLRWWWWWRLLLLLRFVGEVKGKVRCTWIQARHAYCGVGVHLG
jgi:hypothetical protein